MQSPKEETKLWRHSELEWCTNICDILSLKGKESLSIIHGHSKCEAIWLVLHYECPRNLIGIREEGAEKWKTLHKAKTEGRYRKCYKPHTLDIFLFHCTSWLLNTPCKGITRYVKIPTYTLSVYQNKLPALDDFLITFLMKANFQNKIHMKLLETVNRSNFPGGSDSKESAFNAGNLGSIPGLPGSPGTGTGIRLQYGCLENPMDSGVWQAIVHEVAQNWTRLKQLSMDAGQMFTHYGKFVCLVCVFVCLCVLVAS